MQRKRQQYVAMTLAACLWVGSTAAAPQEKTPSSAAPQERRERGERPPRKPQP